MAGSPVALPQQLFRYIVATSWRHQIPLVTLTVVAFLMEVVPLELQRRIVNDAVKDRQYDAIVVLCALYAATVGVQGATKLGMNIYRGWISERANRSLRRQVCASLDGGPLGTEETDVQGTAIAMVVAEVEPVGGFIGISVSEPLLQAGVLATVLAYIVHLDPWMAAAAFALFVPQLVFVPLMQRAMNRRTGLRVWVLRQIGGGIIAHHQLPEPRGEAARQIDRAPAGAGPIERVFQLNMAMLKIKFTMNFLMNLCSHLQIVAALLIGGWLVLNDRIEVGGVVAFISGVGRLNDPWGDLVNYFREASLTVVKYRLVANAVNGATAAATFAGSPGAAAPRRIDAAHRQAS